MDNRRKQITQAELFQMNNPQLSKVSDFSKYAFRYYSTQKTLKKILCIPDKKTRGVTSSNNKGYFWVSNLDGMNDKDEADLHDADKKKVHALCFSNTDDESVPMWYLYSGLLGKGACLRFTSSLMMKFIKSIRVVYPIIQNAVIESEPLVIGKDIEMQYGWIYYYDNRTARKKTTEPAENHNEAEPLAEYFYRNEWYRIKDDPGSFVKDNYFLKKYPWYYEREFRIVFINKTDKLYDRIAVPLYSPMRHNKCLSIILAPETDVNGNDENEWDDIAVKESNLGICMNLFKRNEEDIEEYIRLKEKQVTEAVNTD